MRATVLRARLASFAIVVLVLGMTVPAMAEDTIDSGMTNVADNETSANWFVELTTPSTSDGASAAATTASKDSFRASAKAKGINYSERFAFADLWNGLSVNATAGDISRLQSISGVKNIWPVVSMSLAEPAGAGEQIDLSTAITMTGADYVQNTLGFTGKGIKVAVMDTGIDYDNPDLGGCFGSTCRVFTGWDFVGDSYNADSTAATYQPIPHPDADPDDCNGHGSHVSGIVGAKGAVTGVAPGVRFGAYRVFGCDGSTDSDIMLAAMERALADHMDVLNMSIGSAFQWPQYPTAVAADKLVTKHGMVVVASIGNSGPAVYSAGAPGVGEHVIGVASFDNIETQLPYFSLSGDNARIGWLQATASPNGPTSGTATLARTGTTTTTNDGCAALPAGSLTGKVVLIRRGTCGFYNKALNAQDAGAAGVILYNNAAGYINPTVAPVAPLTTPITIPVVATSDTLGAIVNAHIAAGPTTITWTAETARFGMPTGNTLSSFSSFGLSPDLTIKPDISAPGGSIWSTWPLEKGGHANLSGTSMASPHVAGAVALLLEANAKNLRENGPALVRTLLQNTATPKLLGGTTFTDTVSRQGAGMLDIRAAIAANAYATPSKLALYESERGPTTQTLTLTSKAGTGESLTYTFSHQGALANTASTFAPSFNTAAATVAFSTPTVTIKNNQTASVSVTITPPTSPLGGLYSGYLVATGSDGSTLRVPYSGFIGDYQSKVVLTPVAGTFGAGNSGRVCRATATPGSFALQPFASPGGSFTFASALQLPFFCQHLDHQSRTVTFRARNTATNVIYDAATFEYFGRNSSSTGFFAIDWDGASGAGAARANVPNGIYEITVNVLKALGDTANPAHTEHASLGFLTIARP